MPVIHVPYDNGNAVVLTDACLVMSSDGVFGEASYRCKKGRGERMTPIEFQAVNWCRVLSVRYYNARDKYYPGNGSIIARVSIYGMALSERATEVVNVIMRQIECRHKINIIRNHILPRISWLAYYEKLKQERITAVIMTNHRRLGEGSMLNTIGGDALATIVLRYMMQ